ncbi:MAG TPA: DUF2845 domain-containing protein [Myxococcota bacterium]|nr:DUF2845 domain-containing protein [Myxococcota bacterium]HRY92753.1 DUF2845 domain-containing protein [Myxococcota bacterium]HSA21461.1 DUF2845 domain-containing protein [Myxococcota bacterium]
MKTICAALLALTCLPQVALAFSCPEGFVSTGETLYAVRVKCGEPNYWDQRLERTRLTDRNGRTLELTRTVDEWTYDFGADRLVTTLVFHDGRLRDIRTGSYGGVALPRDDQRPPLLNLGDTLATVLLRWGEPSFSEQYDKIRIYDAPDGRRVERSVRQDILTYDLGPKRLVRVLLFENGKLVEQKTTTRGHPVAAPEPEAEPDPEPEQE